MKWITTLLLAIFVLSCSAQEPRLTYTTEYHDSVVGVIYQDLVLCIEDKNILNQSITELHTKREHCLSTTNEITLDKE